jgi:hypothetical protein
MIKAAISALFAEACVANLNKYMCFVETPLVGSKTGKKISDINILAEWNALD